MPSVAHTPRSPRSVAASLHDYFTPPHHDLTFVSVIEPPALELANAVLEGMKTAENLITVTFHQRSAGETSESAQSVSGSQKAAVRAAESKLLVARNSMREVLKHVSVDSSGKVELEDWVEVRKLLVLKKYQRMLITSLRLQLNVKMQSQAKEALLPSRAGKVTVHGSNANVSHTINEDERAEFTNHINAVSSFPHSRHSWMYARTYKDNVWRETSGSTC